METAALLEICRDERIGEVGTEKIVANKWKRICELLQRKVGGIKTKEMCRNKLGKIKIDYLKWKSGQKKTGAAGISFKYQNEVEDILGDHHHIQPKVLLTSAGIVQNDETMQPTPIFSSPSLMSPSLTLPFSMCQKRAACAPTTSSTSPSLPVKKPKLNNGDLQQSELLRQQIALLEENKKSTDALTAAVRDGMFAIADSIKYLAEKLSKQ